MGCSLRKLAFYYNGLYDGAECLLRPIWKLSLLWCDNAFQLGLKNKNKTPLICASCLGEIAQRLPL